MENILHMQIGLHTTRKAAYEALVSSEALTRWFAEFADVSLEQRKYDFWGKFTPEQPTREQGKHPIVDVQREHLLKYQWKIGAKETLVELRLVERGTKTMLVLLHHGAGSGSHLVEKINFEDFWFLSLENLRRYLDGKPAEARVDFSASMTGNIEHNIEIDAPAERVFEVLIKPEQLERWIASRAIVEQKADGKIDVGWGEGGGPVKILEVVPNQKLAYTWLEPHGETIVTWTLESTGGKTRLTFVHSGFAPDQNTGGYKAGWLNFINWVRSLAEYGEGWQPPLIPLTAKNEPLYPAAIKWGQAEMVSL